MKKYLILLLFNTSLFSQQSMHSNEEYMKRVLNSTQKPNDFVFTDYSKEGNVDVSTGRFGITIPFTTIENEYVSLPISLSYSTSGVKVDENASEIGMGWNLLAGGQISRKVNGNPDDIYVYDANTFVKRSPLEGYPFPFGGDRFSWTTSSGVGSAVAVHENSIERNYGIPAYNEYYSKHFPTPRYTSTPKDHPTYLNINNHPMMSILDMQNNTTKIQTERDVFHVSVGDLNFHFILKVNDSIMNGVDLAAEYRGNIRRSTMPETIRNNEDSYYKAVPLDDNKIKIDILYSIQDEEYFFYDWVDNYTRRAKVKNGLTRFIRGFIVTDTSGVKYYFENYLFTEPQSILTVTDLTSYGIDGHRTIQCILQDVQLNNWVLSKIVTPNNETIDYSYLKSRISEPKIVPREHDGEYTGFPYNLRPQITPDSFSTTNFEYEKLYIEKISSKNKTIQFNYEADTRIDLQGGKQLNNIQLFDVKNLLVKQLDLVSIYKGEQFAFDVYSRVSESPLDYITEYNATHTRLFLDKLIEKNIVNRNTGSIQFDESKNVEHTFEYYNPDNLPNKNAVGFQDLYGYYLGNTIENAYPPFPKLYINPNTEGDKISYYPISSPNSITFNGADRIPNSNTVHFGAMKKINFPTRGSLEIEYEPNQFSATTTIQKNLNGPGCRVKNLKYYSQQDVLVKNKLYNYEQFDTSGTSSGQLMYKPSFAYISNYAFDNRRDFSVEQNKQYYSNSIEIFAFHFKYTITKETLNQEGITDLPTLYKKLITTSTHPIGPQSDNLGRDIIYTNVMEEDVSVDNATISNGNTKYYNFYTDNRTEVNVMSGPTTESTYILPCSKSVVSVPNTHTPSWDAPDTGSNSVMPWFLAYGDAPSASLMVKYGFVEKRGKDIFPFPERNYFNNSDALKMGKTYKTEYFNASNIKVKEILSNYSLIKDNSYKTSNFKINYLHTYYHQGGSNTRYNSPLHFDYAKPGLYFFTIDNLYTKQKMVLSSEETIEYLNTKELVSKTDYIHNPTNFLVTAQNTKNSKNEILETKFYYPQDLLGEPFVDDLITKNIIDTPLKSETYKNTEKLSEKMIEYTKTTNSLLLPKYIYENKGTSSIDKIVDKKITYDQYDDIGNIQQYTPENGVSVSIIWGYNKTLPIAKIENATYSSITPSLITTAQTKSDTGTEAELLTALTAIRTALPYAMVTTYTHKPLIGVSTITDPKGDKLTYEYDELNRLKQVKDKDGNILSENEYHYKN